MQQPRSDPQSIAGTIVAIRGSIVDAHFSLHLPALHHQLRAGDDGTVIIEVASHLNAGTARGIALSPTQGLARGDPIVDTGAPLKAPVGDHVLGRMFNVLGEPIDGKEPLADGEWRSIHQLPMPLTQQEGRMVTLQAAIEGCERILQDEFAEYPEQALYRIGSLDDIRRQG